ncbi:MAG: arylesterase [Alphaproteobacteria bacterium]
MLGLTGREARAGDAVHILAFGDSLTAGYGLARADAFPARLQAALAARGVVARVHDAGVSGDTTATGRARLDWALASVPGATPDLVIVELGANDGLQGLDPARTRANLAAMLGVLTARGVPVLLCGMRAPPNLGRDYGAEFDGIYAGLADAFGVALYPFFLDGVAADRALNQADGLHPNADGVGVIVARILPHVIAALKAAPAR